MPTSDILLFDSGRFPLWFRLPTLVVGLFVLWLAIALAAHSWFGVNMGIPWSGDRGSPLLGFLAALIVAAAHIFVWFTQFRILFDDAQHQLVVRTGGYFRFHERRIPLAGSREIHMRQIHSGLASRKWRLSVEFTDGRSEYITSIPSGVESLARSLETTTKLPVRRFEYAA